MPSGRHRRDRLPVPAASQRPRGLRVRARTTHEWVDRPRPPPEEPPPDQASVTNPLLMVEPRADHQAWLLARTTNSRSHQNGRDAVVRHSEGGSRNRWSAHRHLPATARTEPGHLGRPRRSIRIMVVAGRARSAGRRSTVGAVRSGTGSAC